MVLNALAALGGLGGSIASGIIGNNAADKAAQQQAFAIQRAQDFQRENIGRLEDLFNPSIAQGDVALNQLGDFTGLNGVGAQNTAFQDFRDSPGVSFLRDQGLQGIDRSAASRGALFSGRTLTDASKFNQGVAEQSFGRNLNSLFKLANIGGNSRNAVATGITGANNNLSNLSVQGGNAQATGTINGANATTGALQGGLNSLAFFAGQQNQNNGLNGGGQSAFGNRQFNGDPRRII